MRISNLIAIALVFENKFLSKQFAKRLQIIGGLAVIDRLSTIAWFIGQKRISFSVAI